MNAQPSGRRQRPLDPANPDERREILAPRDLFQRFLVFLRNRREDEIACEIESVVSMDDEGFLEFYTRSMTKKGVNSVPTPQEAAGS